VADPRLRARRQPTPSSTSSKNAARSFLLQRLGGDAVSLLLLKGSFSPLMPSTLPRKKLRVGVASLGRAARFLEQYSKTVEGSQIPEGLAHTVKVVADLVRVNLKQSERGERSHAAGREIDKASLHTRVAVRLLLLADEKGLAKPSAQMMSALAVLIGLEEPAGDDEDKHHRRLESWRKIKQRAKAYLRKHRVTLQKARKAEQRGFLDFLRRRRLRSLGTPGGNSRRQASPRPGTSSDENGR
jgi:hypothetical protein